MKDELKAGDQVRIKSGVFKSFPGRVESATDEGLLLTVAVEIFGRTTRLDLQFWEVEKIEPPDEPGTFYSNN
jgi:transcriptional antiterminator NusG